MALDSEEEEEEKKQQRANNRKSRRPAFEHKLIGLSPMVTGRGNELGDNS